MSLAFDNNFNCCCFLKLSAVYLIVFRKLSSVRC